MPAPDETICASVDRLVARSSLSLAPARLQIESACARKQCPSSSRSTFVVQIAGGEALLPREPVPFGERHDERVVRDAARGPLADVCLEREQARVKPPCAEVGDNRVGLLLAANELQLGVPSADGGHHVRQEIGGDRRDDADPERARARLDELLRGGDHVVDLEEHATRVRDHDGARRRDQDSPAIALEELNAEHVLELLHLRAERRL